MSQSLQAHAVGAEVAESPGGLHCMNNSVIESHQASSEIIGLRKAGLIGEMMMGAAAPSYLAP